MLSGSWGHTYHWKEPWKEFLLEPRGDLQWQFHQHGASLAGNGRFVMFDNGSRRASAFQRPMRVQDSYSRAVVFAIDPNVMTVSQTWAYGGSGSERFYSRYISDASWMPATGNVLVIDGGRQDDADGNPTNQAGRQRHARILEVTSTEPAEKLFEIILTDESPAGYQVHSGQRLESIYP